MLAGWARYVAAGGAWGGGAMPAAPRATLASLTTERERREAEISRQEGKRTIRNSKAMSAVNNKGLADGVRVPYVILVIRKVKNLSWRELEAWPCLLLKG
jgi:hypothetical protein